MTLKRLRLRNLLYHWRGNLAIFLGVVVGTAVLTGALLVGDSLRGSLRDLAVQRLGWVDQALVSPRLVSEDVAGDLLKVPNVTRVCPALVLQGAANPVTGSATKGTLQETGPRVPRVTILGVDARFWVNAAPPVDQPFWQARAD